MGTYILLHPSSHHVTEHGPTTMAASPWCHHTNPECQWKWWTERLASHGLKYFFNNGRDWVTDLPWCSGP